MKKENIENLIGSEIEVLGEDGHVEKKITIKNVKEINGELVVVGDDGNIYSEDELNFTYVATMGVLLYITLANHGIVSENFDEFDADEYNTMVEEFMNRMVSTGYVTDKKEEK